MEGYTQDALFKLALDADTCLTSPSNKFVMSPSAVPFTKSSDSRCTSTPFVGICRSPAPSYHDEGFCTPSVFSYPKTKKSLCVRNVSYPSQCVFCVENIELLYFNSCDIGF